MRTKNFSCKRVLNGQWPTVLFIHTTFVWFVLVPGSKTSAAHRMPIFDKVHTWIFGRYPFLKKWGDFFHEMKTKKKRKDSFLLLMESHLIRFNALFVVWFLVGKKTATRNPEKKNKLDFGGNFFAIFAMKKINNTRTLYLRKNGKRFLSKMSWNTINFGAQTTAPLSHSINVVD